jgi:hypothetical protein
MADIELTTFTRTRIGSVRLDASISENHVVDADISEHPVEDGSDITDNYLIGSRRLTIHGRITNSPIYAAGEPVWNTVVITAANNVGSLITEEDRVEAANTEVTRMMEAAEIITVSTTLSDYENMMIKSYSVDRDVSLANCLDFTMELQEVLIRSGFSQDIPDPILKAKKKKKDKGKITKDSGNATQTDTAQEKTNLATTFDTVVGL